MIEVAKALSYNQSFILQGLSSPTPVLYSYSARVIFPYPCAVFMYKIEILLNYFSPETTWPISTKFYVDPTVETELRLCSNGKAHV